METAQDAGPNWNRIANRHRLFIIHQLIDWEMTGRLSLESWRISVKIDFF